MKVENISKRSSKEDLLEKLQEFEHSITSVHLQPCPDTPVNYAYINCTDTDSAQSIVEAVNNRMLLDSNLLTAKLKGGGGPSGHRVKEVPGPPAKDLATVKVLIDNSGYLTDEQLDAYFSLFGELSSPCKIRVGSPNYAYVNFHDPSAAVAVRAQPEHMVQGVVVTATGGVKPARQAVVGLGGKPHTGVEFVNFKCPCDPLVVKHVCDDVERFLRENKESKVKVTRQSDDVCVYVEQSACDRIQELVKGSIQKQKAQIKSSEQCLPCSVLPVLAGEAFQRKLAEMQVPVEVRIAKSRRPGALPTLDALEELSQSFLSCKDRNVKAEGLKGYVMQLKDSKISYEWFWKDDGGFMPYDPSVSKKLEQALASDLTISAAIGRFDYKIDPVALQQTNTKTGKVREVVRREVEREQGREIRIRIRAHSRHLSEVVAEVVKMLNEPLVEVKVGVPYLQHDSRNMERLLQVAREQFVDADHVTGENAITLKGVRESVGFAEVSLKAKLLSLKDKQSRESVPSHWQPQSDNCQVVEIRRGDREWSEVDRLMAEPGFHVQIKKIERIQNRWLWDRYSESRKRISAKNDGVINEKKLFHGTKSTPPKKIYASEQGFDNRFASSGLWGEGSYFAVRASYSNNYAHSLDDYGLNYKQMFLVQVLTGVACKCPQDRSLKLPPKKADFPAAAGRSSRAYKFEDERYDSVTGHTNGSDVFIIYEHGRVYPAYLVTYKLV